MSRFCCSIPSCKVYRRCCWVFLVCYRSHCCHLWRCSLSSCRVLMSGWLMVMWGWWECWFCAHWWRTLVFLRLISRLNISCEMALMVSSSVDVSSNSVLIGCHGMHSRAASCTVWLTVKSVEVLGPAPHDGGLICPQHLRIWVASCTMDLKRRTTGHIQGFIESL